MIKIMYLQTSILLALTAMTCGLQAEEIKSATDQGTFKSTSSTTSADDLTDAFQREYTYLISQKAALESQKKKLEKNLNQKISTTKQQTTQSQKDLVWLSAENDESHEYLLTLERRKKDLQKRESSLESVYKKAEKSLGEFKSGLYFETGLAHSTTRRMEGVVPTELKVEDFDRIMKESKDLLFASTQIEAFPSSFLNADDKLVDGTVTRIGRSAAIGFIKNKSKTKSDQEYFVLGPDGKGMLKALETSVKPKSETSSLYVFDSLNKIAEVKKHGGFTETLADLSPILFLGMMLMMVLGLFIAMIRV